MKENLANRYNSLYQEISQIIDNTRELGIDADTYEHRIEMFNKMTEGKLEKAREAGAKEDTYITIYNTAIDVLNIYKKDLEKYDIYFKAKNSCDYLDLKMNDKLTEDELDECFNEALSNIKNILDEKEAEYKDKEAIIRRVHEVAYKLIKIEILTKNDSTLYNTIISEGIDTAYFNELVKEDIKKIESDDGVIKARLYQIKKEGLNCNYFDIKLIRGIVRNINHEKFKKGVVKELEAIVSSINDTNDKIVRKAKDKAIEEDNLNDFMEDHQMYKGKLRKRIASLVLAVTLIFGGGAAVHKVATKVNNPKEYSKSVETYTTLNDETNSSSSKVYKSFSTPKDFVIVRVHTSGTDDFNEYVINGNKLKLDTAKDYYLYGDSNYGVTPTTRTDGGNLFTNQFDYTEVKKVNYEYLGIVNSYDDGISAFFIYFMYVIALVVFETACLAAEHRTLIFSFIKRILNALKDVNRSKEELADIAKELESIPKELEELLDKNKELRDRFNALYEENKYLLNDQEELLKRFKNATGEAFWEQYGLNQTSKGR